MPAWAPKEKEGETCKYLDLKSYNNVAPVLRVKQYIGSRNIAIHVAKYGENQ